MGWWCTKQLNRFKRKMNNVAKKFKNENKDLRKIPNSLHT